MGGEVGRAELACPPACQRLRLVAPGEEGELLRIAPADRRKPLGGDGERFLPLDFTEFARAARPDPQQRLLQPRRAVMLHDSGTALAADHAAVHRVVLIAVDVAHLAVLDMDVDAATAGAHVAGGLGDAVAHAWRGVDAVALVRRARVGQRLLGGCAVGAARLSWVNNFKRGS